MWLCAQNIVCSNCRHYDLFVTDFMRRNLVYLSYRSTYLDLKQLLLTSNYASYPLVDAPGRCDNHIALITWQSHDSHMSDSEEWHCNTICNYTWCICVVWHTWKIALSYYDHIQYLPCDSFRFHGPHPLKWLLSAINVAECSWYTSMCGDNIAILTWQSCDSHVSLFPPFPLSDSRILIGSLSRHNLKAMLDDHMKGVHKHAQQIRDQSQLYVRHYQLVIDKLLT